MKMVAHQTIGTHLPVCLLTRFGKCLEEILPVHIILIDALSPVPSAHHMVDSSGIIDSQLPWHGFFLSFQRPIVKPVMKRPMNYFFIDI
jgi:hypothetical protein